jgi:tRNA threonylcarbamoyl adenosine modification protein (Sua5/YciO/YrdC/YwlC family)
MSLSTARRGGLIVIPTESVYAIVTDAFVPRGTSALREFKSLDPWVPLSVLVPSAQTVAGITTSIPPFAQGLMEGLWPGELTLLLEAGRTLTWDHPADAPLAVRMPIHPLALAVLSTTGPLASTSAGVNSLPVKTSQDLDHLEGDAIALILDAGDLRHKPNEVATSTTVTSTVVDCTVSPPRVVRPGACDLATLRAVISEIA